jgi:hypothetical protein
MGSSFFAPPFGFAMHTITPDITPHGTNHSIYSFRIVIGKLLTRRCSSLSGTAFLAYMTRVSSNIVHPRAWIHTQFAVANIASASE